MKHIHWWKVTFLQGREGKINSIERCDAPEACRVGNTILVQAADEDGARKIAYNFYCSRKKKEAIQKKRARGQCACGRTRDRKNPDTGEDFLTCSVCSARRQQQYVRGPATEPRDEAKRIQAMQGRVRDRKNELRLEVLVEVRKAFMELKTVGQFGQWLKQQIDAALQPRVDEQKEP